MRRLCAIAAVMAMTGCATNVWDKPGSTRDDFARDRYGCLQDSQQQSSSAYVNKFGGSSASGMGTNDGLFAACMNSRGWALIRAAPGGTPAPASASAANPIVEVGKTLQAENLAMCSRANLQPVFVKTACDSGQMTLPQFADQSLMADSERTLFVAWRSEVTERNSRLLTAWRTHGGAKGAALASAADKATAQQDQQSLALYTGKTSWGDYNMQRKEIARTQREELAKISAAK